MHDGDPASVSGQGSVDHPGLARPAQPFSLRMSVILQQAEQLSSFYRPSIGRACTWTV